MTGTAVVFVHGFLSSARAWSQFVRLIGQDDALTHVTVRTFEYESPLVSLNPARRIPTLDDIADSLRTFLSHDLVEYPRLVLVSHSQGGLVVQRALARMLLDDDQELARIRLVVMYACPNAGSDLALPLRRTIFRGNPQEADLRPLRAAVLDAQRAVLNRIVHASDSPTRVLVFAGESDGVVTPTSARSVFPAAGVVPGDHSSVIRPDSPEHRSYVVLRRALLSLSTTEEDPVPTDEQERGSQQRRPARPPRQRGAPAEPTIEQYGELVDLLLEVPGMHDPSFRQQLYGLLPTAVQAHLPRNSMVRLELVGVAMTLWRYRHLHTWSALASALTTLVPDHPVTAELLTRLAALDGTAAR